MTVGFFAPLPPAPTGVAEYAADLLAALKQEALRHRGRVEIESDAGVALYHIGNNHLHRSIYQRALERPGVAVLHDAVLQHFFLGTLGEAGYTQEFIYNYGEWTRDLAGGLWRQRARSAADPRYFAYPMLKRIATVSRAVIVHNPAAARIVRLHAPEAEVIEIPHRVRFAARNGAGRGGHSALPRRLGIGPAHFADGRFRSSARIETAAGGAAGDEAGPRTRGGCASVGRRRVRFLGSGALAHAIAQRIRKSCARAISRSAIFGAMPPQSISASTCASPPREKLQASPLA